MAELGEGTADWISPVGAFAPRAVDGDGSGRVGFEPTGYRKPTCFGPNAGAGRRARTGNRPDNPLRPQRAFSRQTRETMQPQAAAWPGGRDDQTGKGDARGGTAGVAASAER